MDFSRIYEYRFRGVEPEYKIMVWTEISRIIYRKLGNPEKIIDPAGGQGEFINAVPSGEKWVVDINEEFIKKNVDKKTKSIVGNILIVDLPKEYYDGIFVSNFLEHLNDQEQISEFLRKMFEILKPGGRIAILGPNFKYCYKNYFDFADHNIALTETSVAEHLYGAGLEPIAIYSKFLPVSFRGKIKVSKLMIRIYLNFPIFWKIIGKQFLLIAKKP